MTGPLGREGVSQEDTGLPTEAGGSSGAQRQGSWELVGAVRLFWKQCCAWALRDTRRRQFSPKANSVLFNFELKYKQSPAPAAPTPDQIWRYDLCGRRPAFRGGTVRGRMAPGPGPTTGLVGGSHQGLDHLSGTASSDGGALPPKLNFNPAHKSSSRSPATPTPTPAGSTTSHSPGEDLGEPPWMLCGCFGKRDSRAQTVLRVPLATSHLGWACRRWKLSSGLGFGGLCWQKGPDSKHSPASCQARPA